MRIEVTAVQRAQRRLTNKPPLVSSHRRETPVGNRRPRILVAIRVNRSVCHHDDCHLRNRRAGLSQPALSRRGGECDRLHGGRTLYYGIANGANAIAGDTAEAYIWGLQFEWGYWKHPPLWAWIAGLWFDVFPNNVWGLAALCALNATVGLLGAWKLNGCFSAGRERIVATVLLLLMPFYTLLAFRYNANALFLSLWPWTAYFFVKSIDRMRLPDSLWFGVLAGLTMLTKYYAVILLVTCVAAVLVHPNRRKYLTSLQPYAAAGFAAIVFAPHLYWLIQHDFSPLTYFDQQSGRNLTFSIGQFFMLVLQHAAYILPPIALVAIFGGLRPKRWREGLKRRFGDARFRFLLVLCFFPAALTLIASLAFGLVISENTMSGIFCLVPVLLLQSMDEVNTKRLLQVSIAGACAIAALALVFAPLVKDIGPRNLAFSKEYTASAENLWRQHSHRPIAYIAGTKPFSERAVFYAGDRPTEFIHFSVVDAPWVSLADLSRRGFVAICAREDSDCVQRAKSFAPGEIFEQAIRPAPDAGAEKTGLIILAAPPPDRAKIPLAKTGLEKHLSRR